MHQNVSSFFYLTVECIHIISNVLSPAAALLASRRLFVNNNVDTRRKILFLLTDFHFDNNVPSEEMSRVVDVMADLRRSVTSLKGVFNVYGVGVGTYFNQTNMQTILKAGNGADDSCSGQTRDNWLNYIRGAGRLPIKGKTICLICINQLIDNV
jgi:hypothetical protein